MKISDGYAVSTCGHAAQRWADCARIPFVAVARRAATSACRCTAVAIAARCVRYLCASANFRRLSNKEVVAGLTAVRVGNSYAVVACGEVDRRLACLSIAPQIVEWRKTIRIRSDAPVCVAIAQCVRHRSGNAHQSNGHHLVGRSSKDARIAANDAADVRCLVHDADIGTEQVLTSGSGNVGPVHTVQADLPLIGRG